MPPQTRGVIAAGHPKTAEAGIEILRQGGNAFDAAAAAVLASFVAESTLTSVAGGGFLLAHTQDNQNILFDFFTQTPSRKRPVSEIDFYPALVDFGGVTQEFHIGLGSMAVPGNLRGVFEFHRQLGKLPFSVVAEPAIHYASQGVELNDFQSYCLTLLKPILLGSAASRQIYAPQGELLQPSGTLVMKDLANTLSYLVAEGPDAFYKGEIAQKLVADCQSQGGYLTLEDLSNYQVITRRPLEIDYRGNTLLTNPPPSSGGILIAFALELLSGMDLAANGFGASRHLQALAEIMRLTNLARKDKYDANIYQQAVDQQFLSAVYLELYKQQLTNIVQKLGSTTHISVIDREGNAASVTTSNGEGSSYVIPGTGIMVNNMLGEEDLNPLGFHQWPANVRMSSMMAPTIVLKDQQPEIVLGSGGSNRIRTAILQVISNIIDFGMDVGAAVDAPRVHWENDVFNLEPGFDPQAVTSAQLPDLTQSILWNQQNMFFGGVHTVMRYADGELAGAGDRRRSGVVATC